MRPNGPSGPGVNYFIRKYGGEIVGTHYRAMRHREAAIHTSRGRMKFTTGV